MGDGHWVGMDALLELTPTQRLLQESQPVTPHGSIHELVRPSAPCSDYVHRRLRDGASSPASPGIGNQWQCQPGGKGCKPPPLFAHDPAPRLALNWQQRRLRYQNASWLPSGWARAAQRRSSRRDIGRGGGTYPGFLYLQIITPARKTHFLGSCKPQPPLPAVGVITLGTTPPYTPLVGIALCSTLEGVGDCTNATQTLEFPEASSNSAP